MWIIETWMGRRVFDDKSFDSFDEARGFITEHADQAAKNEEEFDGICADLYAVEVMDPLDALLIETRDQAHDFAVRWQRWSGERRLSHNQLNDWLREFEKLAEKFDLTEEFCENGVI